MCFNIEETCIAFNRNINERKDERYGRKQQDQGSHGSVREKKGEREDRG